LALPSPAIPEIAGREILERSGVAGLVIATVPADEQPAGALVMGSHGTGLDTEEWLTFARVVGTQLGYALALRRDAGAGGPLEGRASRKPPSTARSSRPPRVEGRK
jgi:hypothetical protein